MDFHTIRCPIRHLDQKFLAGAEIMANQSDIDQIVQDILADMSLKEKAAIANLDEDKVPYLQYGFDTCVRSQTGNDDQLAKDVMYRIWKALQGTHRIRSVKQKGQALIKTCPKEEER